MAKNSRHEQPFGDVQFHFNSQEKNIALDKTEGIKRWE